MHGQKNIKFAILTVFYSYSYTEKKCYERVKVIEVCTVIAGV